jgi:hypothetical protein
MGSRSFAGFYRMRAVGHGCHCKWRSNAGLVFVCLPAGAGSWLLGDVAVGRAR